MAHSTDIKGKIRRILALAESPNENEAKAALLKARALMAKHKLTEAELMEAEKQTIKNTLTDITCSKRRDPWIVSLSAVIGENYCCKGYRIHIKGRQTQAIGFIGLEDDVEICATIFKYAVDFARAEIKRIKKENGCYFPRYVKNLCDSYGFGFSAGIQENFSQQQKEHDGDWGLILVPSKEVEAASKHLKREVFKAQVEDGLIHDGYTRGYFDGKKFDPPRRIGEEETT